MPERGVGIIDFARLDLQGGTLVAAMPNLGIGPILLTDYLLESAGMEHVASADSEHFGPVAMVFQGRPRFPVRIHADARLRLALLRSEVPAHPHVFRALAQQVVGWAKRQELERILVLDGVMGPAPAGADLLFVSNDKGENQRLAAAGMRPFAAGVVGGLGGALLLESRKEAFPVVGLMAVLGKAEDDLASCLRFADALGHFFPDLQIDRKRMRSGLASIGREVRRMRKEAEGLMRRKAEPAAGPEEFV